MASIAVQVKDDNGTVHNLVINPAALTDARLLVLARGGGYQSVGPNGPNHQAYQDYILQQVATMLKAWHNNQLLQDAQAAVSVTPIP